MISSGVIAYQGTFTVSIFPSLDDVEVGNSGSFKTMNNTIVMQNFVQYMAIACCNIICVDM